MDDTLIYVKTLAGERAMMERTRLVQRNLRMVLILVECHSSVADLKAKIGGSIIVESALTELQQMGLIEPFNNRRRDFTPPESDASPPPSPLPSDLNAAPEPRPAESSPLLVTHETAGDAPLAADTVFEPFEAIAAEINGARSEPAAIAEQDESPLSAEPGRPGLAARFRAWRERRAATREESQFDKVYREDPTEPIIIKPIPKRDSNKRSGRSWLLALPGLFVALVLLVLLFPYGSYAPEIEAAVAMALHSPVRIEAIRFSLAPYPNLTLQRVAVGGSPPYATIGEARLVPDPLSFWSATPSLLSVELAQVQVRSAGIEHAAQWLSGGDAGWRVRRGRVDGLSVELGGNFAGGLAGDLAFATDGTLAKLMLRSDTMRIEAVPAGKLFRLGLASDSLILPNQPAMKISDFTAAGDLTAKQLRLSDINAHFYDGRLDGKMTFDWSSGASLVGDFAIKRTDLGKLLAAISPDSSFAGDLMGKAHIEAQSPALNGLANDLRIDGSFVGQRVVIERFGLVDAVIAHNRGPTRSGTTRLDSLGGTLQCDLGACRIGGLTMSSGVMRASGQTAISRSTGKLDGTLQVEMLRSANDINSSVSIQGSLAYPEVNRR